MKVRRVTIILVVVLAAVVSDDDLDEGRRKIPGLGNHPDAGLRAVVALDDAGDVALRKRRSLLRAQRRRRHPKDQRENRQCFNHHGHNGRRRQGSGEASPKRFARRREHDLPVAS